MTMLAQEPKQLLRPQLEQRLLTPIQFLRGIPAWNSHRLLLAFCVYGGADHTLGIEVDPEVVTDRNDLVFEPIGALALSCKHDDDRRAALSYLAADRTRSSVARRSRHQQALRRSVSD